MAEPVKHVNEEDQLRFEAELQKYLKNIGFTYDFVLE